MTLISQKGSVSRKKGSQEGRKGGGNWPSESSHLYAGQNSADFMERLLRRAVLWRRRSFGCASQAGCRFVERILTVVQTCRLQARDTLGYLHSALRAHRAGQTCPSLLPNR